VVPPEPNRGEGATDLLTRLVVYVSADVTNSAVVTLLREGADRLEPTLPRVAT
jgi:hypothetical protein